MKTIKQINVKNKKVIVRVDYNVPIQNGIILDDNRIKQSLKTIKYLIKQKSKIILISHLGKIKSEKDKKDNSLLIVSERLSKLLNKKINFCCSHNIKDIKTEIEKLNYGEILLLENTRFMDYPNNLESGCDEMLSKKWASLGEIFIMDAFGAIHRKHASTYGIPSILPSAIGFLVEKELKELDKVKNKAKNLLLGGAKVEDKIKVIENLIDTTNYCLIGGLMSATFLKAKGINVGYTHVDDNSIEYADKLLKENKDKIILPIDVVTENGIKDVTKINENETIYDIGPKTIEMFKSKLNKKMLTICNGTMGKYEEAPYENGTKELLKHLNNTNTVILGGDTSSAVNKYSTKVKYISTGGGASLEYLLGKTLPGLEIINEEMAKTGFTLTEILVVIAILGMIIAIAIPSITAIRKKMNERVLSTKKEEILTVAKLYAKDNKIEYDVLNQAYITVDDLIKEHYISPEVQFGKKNCTNGLWTAGCVMNSVTGEALNNEIIELTKNQSSHKAGWVEEVQGKHKIILILNHGTINKKNTKTILIKKNGSVSLAFELEKDYISERAILKDCSSSIKINTEKNTIDINNVTEDNTCTITFVKNVYQVAVSSNNTSYGTVSPSPQIVNHGENATFTLSPKTGYEYSSNDCGGTVSGNTLTISNVTSAKTCTVTFAKNVYQVAVSSNNTSYGTVSPSPQMVNHGENATFTLSPKTGYKYSSNNCGGTVSGNTLTISNITSAKTCTVTFAKKTYVVRVSSNNTSYGTVTPSSKTVSHGNKATFTLSPKTGYKYSSNNCGGTVSGNTLTISNITSAKTCTVTFAKETYIVRVSSNNSCATIAEDAVYVNYGESAEIIVTSNPNPRCVYKGNNCEDVLYMALIGDNSYSFILSNVTENKRCTLYFDSSVEY